jgi:hypothetical protein
LLTEQLLCTYSILGRAYYPAKTVGLTVQTVGNTASN